MIRAREAADPLVFASPQSASPSACSTSGPGALGDRRRSRSRTRAAAPGPGRSRSRAAAASGARLEVPAEVVVPGTLAVEATSQTPAPGRASARVSCVLTRGAERRRIPFWYRVTRPGASRGCRAGRSRAPAHVCRATRAGHRRGSATYRYPDRSDARAPRSCPARSRSSASSCHEPAANLGVSVVELGRRASAVQPRIVPGADENRLAGASALPYVGNPYLPVVPRADRRRPPCCFPARAPTRSSSTRRAPRAGGTLHVPALDRRHDAAGGLARCRASATGGRVLARVRDAGAGVDPAAIRYRIDDGPCARASLIGDLATSAPCLAASKGRHRLELRVSDRQEAKNNENLAAHTPEHADRRDDDPRAGRWASRNARRGSSCAARRRDAVGLPAHEPATCAATRRGRPAIACAVLGSSGLRELAAAHARGELVAISVERGQPHGAPAPCAARVTRPASTHGDQDDFAESVRRDLENLPVSEEPAATRGRA